MITEKTALLLDDNLLSATRVQAQLERCGFRVHAARILLADEPTPQIVLINLGSRSLPGVEFIVSCRARFPVARVLGYCGHLEVAIRRAARDAGISRLLTNEQALQSLEEVLSVRDETPS